MADEPLLTLDRVTTKLKAMLLEVMDNAPQGAHHELDRHGLQRSLRNVWKTHGKDVQALKLTSAEEDELFSSIIDEVAGLGPIARFMDDPDVSEIMVNGPSEIFIERNGRLERVDVQFRNEQQLSMVIERLLSSMGLSVSESAPICDGSLPNGSRVNVIIPPLVLNGPTVTIRRQVRDWTMKDYLEVGALDERVAEFLQACVKAKVNMVISGGTSTGKTTLVTILSSFIPREERVITIENVPELQLAGRDHWVRLVGRPGNIEGRGEVSLRVLVKNALRMRPDRIILGEARGGEALDVVQAMHVGHDGIITVLHGNSPSAALERLETMMLMSGLDLPSSACRKQIASAVELVIHAGRFADGSRRVECISQVMGVASEGDGFLMEDLFRFELKGFDKDDKVEGDFQYTGARPKFLKKFRLNHVSVPAWMTT